MTSQIFQKKISAINGKIDAGDYRAALAELCLFDNKNIALGQRQRVDRLRLTAYNRLQWLVEAAPVAYRLAEYPVPNWEDCLEIALFYVLTAQIVEAERFIRQAIASNKQSPLLASELAILYEQQGDREKALAIYNRLLATALQRKKFDAVGARVLARLTGLRLLSDTEIEQIDAMCTKYAGGDLEIRLLYGLAKACSKSGEIDKEVDYLIKANRLSDVYNESQPNPQTIRASQERLKAIESLFNCADPDWMQDYVTSDKFPVFILGMPRSGTTLLEQILGAHSKIGNSGESRAMGIAFQRQLIGKPLLAEDRGKSTPYLRYKALSRDDSKTIIEYYDAYQALLSDDPIITDKEMSNVERLGIILKLYPKAKFVCIQRHPLDVCVSILQHDFLQAYYSGSSLKIVQEYEVYYKKVRHWKTIYPDALWMLSYESLVNDFEFHTRELMGFLNLSWEDNLARFHQRGNSVRTPSLSQVRVGINSDSVGKWRNYRELISKAEKYLQEQGCDEHSIK